MNEEYLSIREEMLKRFEAADQLIFFCVVSLGAIYSWLATQVLNTLFVFGDPFFFVIIGLVIIFYTFSKYLNIHKRIYNQGGYLVAYYEIESKDNDTLTLKANKWHILSRLSSELYEKKKIQFGWGWSGKANAIFLLGLGLAVWFAPIYLMIGKINFFVYPTQIITMTISIIISCFIVFLTIVPLCRLKQEMYKNMSKWVKIKENMGETLNLTKSIKFKETFNKVNISQKEEKSSTENTQK